VKTEKPGKSETTAKPPAASSRQGVTKQYFDLLNAGTYHLKERADFIAGGKAFVHSYSKDDKSFAFTLEVDGETFPVSS
jgi:hypothetical protein